jgi:hypothetical protein
MNSAAIPHRTNRAIHRLVRLAHRRRVGVVAFTLTPWGGGAGDSRWQGARALRALRSTRTIVDFVMGRLSPNQAFGRYANELAEREGWPAEELPDISIDLYDSNLRDQSAQPWPIEEVRAWLQGDAHWQRSVEGLTAREREARLAEDATMLADTPRWFLRPEYSARDFIHPNREGHRVIAETACPQLPESWGCQCPSPGEGGE